MTASRRHVDTRAAHINQEEECGRIKPEKPESKTFPAIQSALHFAAQAAAAPGSHDAHLRPRSKRALSANAGVGRCLGLGLLNLSRRWVLRGGHLHSLHHLLRTPGV